MERCCHARCAGVPSTRSRQQHERRRAADLDIRTLHGRQAPPPGRQPTIRRQSRPHSGPLRAFQTRRCTSGHPREIRKVPVNAVSQRRWLRPVRHAGTRTLNINPSTGAPSPSWHPQAYHGVSFTPGVRVGQTLPQGTPEKWLNAVMAPLHTPRPLPTLSSAASSCWRATDRSNARWLSAPLRAEVPDRAELAMVDEIEAALRTALSPAPPASAPPTCHLITDHWAAPPTYPLIHRQSHPLPRHPHPLLPPPALSGYLHEASTCFRVDLSVRHLAAGPRQARDQVCTLAAGGPNGADRREYRGAGRDAARTTFVPGGADQRGRARHRVITGERER